MLAHMLHNCRLLPLGFSTCGTDVSPSRSAGARAAPALREEVGKPSYSRARRWYGSAPATAVLGEALSRAASHATSLAQFFVQDPEAAEPAAKREHTTGISVTHSTVRSEATRERLGPANGELFRGERHMKKCGLSRTR